MSITWRQHELWKIRAGNEVVYDGTFWPSLQSLEDKLKFLKGRIIRVRGSCLSLSEIQRVGCLPVGVIQVDKEEWEEEGTTAADQDIQIREMVEATPFTNAVRIQEDLHGKRINTDGIHRI